MVRKGFVVLLLLLSGCGITGLDCQITDPVIEPRECEEGEDCASEI